VRLCTLTSADPAHTSSVLRSRRSARHVANSFSPAPCRPPQIPSSARRVSAERPLLSAGIRGMWRTRSRTRPAPMPRCHVLSRRLRRCSLPVLLFTATPGTPCHVCIVVTAATRAVWSGHSLVLVSAPGCGTCIRRPCCHHALFRVPPWHGFMLLDDWNYMAQSVCCARDCACPCQAALHFDLWKLPETCHGQLVLTLLYR
jgi:hypothetical protein